VLEAMAVSRAYRATSLETPVGGDDHSVTLGATLGWAEDGFELAEHRALLDRLLSCLSARDREVLRLRFEEDLPRAEISERVGVSPVHVSRIIRRSLTCLRELAAL
jgi:RNA polymerase sigma-B factor